MLAPLRGKHGHLGTARLEPRPRVSRNSTTKKAESRSHACPAKPVQAWHTEIIVPVFNQAKALTIARTRLQAIAVHP